MEKTVKHRFLNNALFTALIVPLAFFVLRDTISILTELMFRSIGGEDSLLYQINDDIARLIIAGLLMLIMPIFFRGRCNFGFKGGFLKLGILLSLPALIVPVWNLLQIKLYDGRLLPERPPLSPLYSMASARECPKRCFAAALPCQT